MELPKYARARFGKLVQYSAKLKYTDLDNIFPEAKLEGGMGGGYGGGG